MKFNKLGVLLLLLIGSCTPKIKPANSIKLSVNLSDSQSVRTYLNEFEFIGPVIKTFEQPGSINYKAHPYTSLYIDDSLYYLLHSDVVTINKDNHATSVKFQNRTNASFNSFANEYRNIKFEIIHRKTFYIADNKDSLIQNFYFSEQYEAKDDFELNQLIDSLALKYGIKESEKILFKKREILNRISTSYVTVKSFFPELKAQDLLTPRLLWYLNRYSSADPDSFLIYGFYYHLLEITLLLTERSVIMDATPSEFAWHLNLLKQYLKPKDPSFQYLVSVLYTRAKNKNISFTSLEMKELKRLARKSPFRDLYKTYLFNHRFDYLENNPHSQNYFDESGNEYTLSSMLAPYKNMPIIIDFWATWCLPCIQNIPNNAVFVDRYPGLNIIMISSDKRNEAWKGFLKENELSAFPQFRKNAGNKDSIAKKIATIPKYGFVNPVDMSIDLKDEINDTIIKNYLKKFENIKQ
ncbi:MAG: TlpA disulfide reductase family protein [Ferruginibacter sp.]